MRLSNVRRVLIVTLVVSAVVFATLSVAGAAQKTVSLRTIELRMFGGNQPVAPVYSAYFEPNFFSENATLYPSNGSDYMLSLETTSLAGRGPHGGYDTATNKCGVCHSAHKASNMSLLRSGSTGCEYCHLGSVAVSRKTVYRANSGDPYQLDVNPAVPMNSGHQLGENVKVPGSSYAGTFNFSCSSCHSVHGASIWKPADFFQSTWTGAPQINEPSTEIGYKLLRANPSGSFEGTRVVATASPADIGNLAHDPRVVNQFALSFWCASCHDKAFQQTDGVANPLTFELSAETTSPHLANGKGVAVGFDQAHTNPIHGKYNGASQCYTCHRGGLNPAPAGLDPAVTEDNHLLSSMPTTGTIANHTPLYSVNKVTDIEKARCAVCHYGTATFAADQSRRASSAQNTSDWPHSSINDIALLGNWTVDGSNPYSEANPYEAVITTMQITKTNYQRYVCGRCHPTANGTSFALSFHDGQHVFNQASPSWATTNTIGTINSIYSPGW